jgi:CMD domain protein
MMSDAKPDAVANAAPDLLNALVGIEVDSAVGALRAQRSEIASYIQGSYDALLEPVDEAGVSRLERGLAALRVAILEQSATLIDHYRAYLAKQGAPADLVTATERAELGAPLSPRLLALLEHVDRLTKEPRVATPEDLATLKAQGLSDANIVTISQLIAFLSFQVRVIAGLQLLAEGL